MNDMQIAYAFFERKFNEMTEDEIKGHYACAEIALRRIIPQKPIDKSQNPEDWHIMSCPNCNRVFWNSGDFVHYQPFFCEKCGQAIDWSKGSPERG